MALVSLTAFLREQMPLSATLSMRADQLFPEKVVLSIDWAAELCTSGGVLHGGVIMSVAGSAAALYPFLNLPQGAAGAATVEAKANFIAAIGNGTVTATKPTHACWITDDRRRDRCVPGGRPARGQGDPDPGDPLTRPLPMI